MDPVLKTKDLTWKGGVIWTPQTMYDESVAKSLPLTVDGGIEISKFQYGEPAALLDLWIDPEELALPEGKIAVYTIIKFSGQNEHRIPVELKSLQPFLGRVADHQFSVSRQAKDKIGYLVVRQTETSPGKKIIGDSPHQDYSRFGMPVVYPMALAFFVASGFQLRDGRAGLKATWDKVANIYHTATAFPTLVQGRALDTPLDATGKMGKTQIEKEALNIFSARPDLFTSARPAQAAMANSYTWHAAPVADCERKRLYVHLAYVPCW